MNISVFDEIECMAARESWIHLRDPRAKIVVVFGFVVAMVSFPRTAVSALLPLSFFLAWWASVANVSARWILKKLVVPLLLLALFGAANLFFERETALFVGGFSISTGFLSWVSLLLRAVFSLSILLLLTSTTGISSIAAGMVRLGVPQVFVATIVLVFRYLFVLADEAGRMNRARVSRSFGRRGLGMGVAATLLGQLMVRALARSERIHAAMLARGGGKQKMGFGQFRWNRSDTVFVFVSFSFFLSVRFLSITGIMGNMILGVVPQ